MENNKPLLEAKNLRISFRTINGTVKAVRGIDFKLYKGRTLGIVGESGSGKSVTSRAVMGILAGNRIIEDGQIIYDGKDLLSLSEEDFCKLRGRKISMIFQDPMSSLNPIMKIGNQLTETMFLKEKSTIKEANGYIKIFQGDFEKIKNKKEADSLFEKLKTIYLDEAEFNRTKEALNTLKERIKLHLDTVLLNEFSYKSSKAKEALKEIKFLIKDCANKFNNVGFDTEHIVLPLGEENLTALFNGTEVCNNKNEFAIEEFVKFFGKIATYKLTRKNTKGIVEFSKNCFNELLEVVDAFEKKIVLQFRVELTSEEKREYDELFNQANALEQQRYEDALKHSLELLKSIDADLFNGAEFDVKKAKKDFKTLKTAINASSFRYSSFKDTSITIIANSLFALLDNYIEVLNFEKKQEELRKKNGGSAELTVKQRAFLSEVQNGSHITVEKMKSICEEGIKHLEAIVKKPTKYKVEDAKELLKNSFMNSIKVLNKVKANIRAIALMREVGISEPEKRIKQYPFEFSGGMRQRIVIAIALSSNPEILICDEPTTALDVTIQAQILDLINKLKAEKNLSVIFITHDLGVIANMADDIAVMYAGKIVEYGTCEDIFYNPRHPYTWALLSSMPDLDTKDKLDAIPGTPPNMILPPKGDAFAARNKYALNIDLEEFPPFFKVSDSHFAATWLLDKNAPKVEPPKIVVDRIQKVYDQLKKEKKLEGPILDNPFIKTKKGDK